MTEMQYYSAVSILLNQFMHAEGLRCTVGVGAHEYLLARLHSSWRYSSVSDPSIASCPDTHRGRAMVLSGEGVPSALSTVAQMGFPDRHSICVYGVVDAEGSATALQATGYEAVAVPELHLVLGSSAGTTTSLRLKGKPTLSAGEVSLLFPRTGPHREPTAVEAQEGALDKPVLGWFHVACMNGGDLIAAELHGQLLSSGLYDKAAGIQVTLLGDEGMRNRLKDNIFSRYDKYRILLDSPDLGRYEWPSMRHMWEMSRDTTLPEFDAFYIHTKAASNCRPDVDNRIQGNLRNWRHCMSHFVIDRWEDNLRALRSGGYWASGPLYQDCKHPSTGGIFAGNFWWAQSSHLAQLCDPMDLSEWGTNRAAAEPWVCTRTGDKYHNQFWLETTDPYDFNNDFGEPGPLARERWRNK